MRWLAFFRGHPYEVVPIAHLVIGLVDTRQAALCVHLTLGQRRWYWELLDWSLQVCIAWRSTGQGFEPWSGREWSGPCSRFVGFYGFKTFNYTRPHDAAAP